MPKGKENEDFKRQRNYERWDQQPKGKGVRKSKDRDMKRDCINNER